MSGGPTAPLTVLAPVDGRVLALAQVPDAVFAQGMVGPGVALQPDEAGPCGRRSGTAMDVRAPVSGTVVALHAHALVVQAAPDRAVLVHLGVNTATLARRRCDAGTALFRVLVRTGDAVRAGQVVLQWHPAGVARTGLSTVVPVVALGATAAAVQPVARGGHLRAGVPLLTWV